MRLHIPSTCLNVRVLYTGQSLLSAERALIIPRKGKKNQSKSFFPREKKNAKKRVYKRNEGIRALYTQSKKKKIKKKEEEYCENDG